MTRLLSGWPSLLATLAPIVPCSAKPGTNESGNLMGRAVLDKSHNRPASNLTHHGPVQVDRYYSSARMGAFLRGTVRAYGRFQVVEGL